MRTLEFRNDIVVSTYISNFSIVVRLNSNVHSYVRHFNFSNFFTPIITSPPRNKFTQQYTPTPPSSGIQQNYLARTCTFCPKTVNEEFW